MSASREPDGTGAIRSQIRHLARDIVYAETSTEEDRAVEKLREMFVPRHRPVTMAMAAELEAAGSYATAEIARKYAVDRPRWWHRFTRRWDSHAV